MKAQTLVVGVVALMMAAAPSSAGKPVAKAKLPVAQPKPISGVTSKLFKARVAKLPKLKVQSKPKVNPPEMRAAKMGVPADQVLPPVTLSAAQPTFHHGAVSGDIGFYGYSAVEPASNNAYTYGGASALVMLRGLKSGKRYLVECEMQSQGGTFHLTDRGATLDVSTTVGSGRSDISYVHHATGSFFEVILYADQSTSYNLLGCNITEQR